MTVADTSLIAYQGIMRKLARSQYIVLKCIQASGPITNKEIAKWLGKEINKITGRCKELRDRGLVSQHGIKIIEGYPAKTWIANYPTELF